MKNNLIACRPSEDPYCCCLLLLFIVALVADVVDVLFYGGVTKYYSIINID